MANIDYSYSDNCPVCLAEHDFRTKREADAANAEWCKNGKRFFGTRWISVDARLPDNSRDVLTYNGEVFGMEVLNYRDGDWWRALDGIWAGITTHWMELPEKPGRAK